MAFASKYWRGTFQNAFEASFPNYWATNLYTAPALAGTTLLRSELNAGLVVHAHGTTAMPVAAWNIEVSIAFGLIYWSTAEPPTLDTCDPLTNVGDGVPFIHQSYLSPRTDVYDTTDHIHDVRWEMPEGMAKSGAMRLGDPDLSLWGVWSFSDPGEHLGTAGPDGIFPLYPYAGVRTLWGVHE